MFQLNKQLPNQKPVVSTFDSLSVNSVEPSHLPLRGIQIFFFFLLPFSFLLLISCEKNTTNPPPSTGPDTTSHNFTWQIDTIGIRNSVLFDVAVINENNIWAVGKIHTAETDTFDSLGNWVPPFNAVYWNGMEWEMKRFMKEDNGNLSIIIPVRDIWYVADNNIWLAAGSIYHWDGEIAELSYLRNIGTNETVEKLWYNSQNDIYGVGNEGLIVHYNGSNWQKLESNTTIDLLDVYGSPDGNVVWACGYTDFVGTILLKITGTAVEVVYEDIDNWFNIRPDSISGVLTSLWTNDPSKLYIITPAGMYIAPADTRGEAERIWFNNDYLPGFPHRIRGQAENDIVTVGDFTMISHYNGSSWKYFEYLQNNGRLRAVSIYNDLIVAVGLGTADIFSIAIVMTGRR